MEYECGGHTERLGNNQFPAHKKKKKKNSGIELNGYCGALRPLNTPFDCITM